MGQSTDCAIELRRYCVGVARCIHGLRNGGSDYLFGATFAGDEDADPFDHFGGRAGSLGKEDVGVDGSVEGVDGAGDDHGGKTGVELLGAADKLVAIHLGHEEVAEEKVERAGERLFDNLERLLRALCGDDAVAAGFEKEGADREYLFVVIYAEDRFLRAHAFSLLPDVTLW